MTRIPALTRHCPVKCHPFIMRSRILPQVQSLLEVVEMESETGPQLDPLPGLRTWSIT